MRVLFLSSEVAPFSKTGGLADVAGALPAALAELGHHVDVVTAAYGLVSRGGFEPLERTLTLRFPYGSERLGVLVRRLSERHRVFLLDHWRYQSRDGVYG